MSPARSCLPLHFSLQRANEIFKGEKARLIQSSYNVFAKWSWDLIYQQRYKLPPPEPFSQRLANGGLSRHLRVHHVDWEVKRSPFR